VEKCPKSGETPLCLVTNATTNCNEFASLGFGSKQVFTSCLEDGAANEISKEINAQVTSFENQLMVFKHFAW